MTDIVGDANELNKAADLLATEGIVTKDSSDSGSNAYVKVIKIGVVTVRFFIDHRTGMGTIKIRSGE